MSTKKITTAEIVVFILTVVLTVGIPNFLFFNRDIEVEPMIKVDSIGDTVILEYANPNDSYSIQGIDNSFFDYANGFFAFYSKDYKVSDNGEAYSVIDSNGNHVASVKLERRDNTDIHREVLLIDLSKSKESLQVISKNYNEVKIFSSIANEEYNVSFKIEDRTEPLEVVFDNVSITAPDLSPVIYSVCDADVNIIVNGTVKLKGGQNPYTYNDVSDFERFFKTVGVSANAYYVCMISAVGGAASIIYGVDYYMDMFKGITSLQLNALSNVWGQIDNLVYGEDGSPGLDGVCAVQIAGDLNIVGNESARLTLIGGDAGHGDDATNSYMTSPPKGGDGGNGGSAMVCNRFANNLSDRLVLKSGNVGLGGFGGQNIKGEKGKMGKVGDQLAPKVVLSDYDITFNP